MILHINTSDQKVIAVQVKNKDKILGKLSRKNIYGSQVLLPLIQKLLSSKKLTTKDLSAIEVDTGPGSFTGIRVGVSVANALGYSLNIPVNGKKLESDLIYLYSDFTKLVSASQGYP